MAYWLLKTEPGTYAWEHLLRDGRTFWDGVRNYAARNNLRSMKVGDEAFFYHSVGPRLIIGITEVVKEAYPDPTTDDPAWVCVDIAPKAPLARPVSLDEVKAHPGLADMALVKLSRLSVQPVTADEWQAVLALAARPHADPARLARQANQKAPPKKPKAPAAKRASPEPPATQATAKGSTAKPPAAKTPAAKTQKAGA